MYNIRNTLMSFKYYIPKADSPLLNTAYHLQFSGQLECKQCEARTKTGAQCRSKVCIGLPFCWRHRAQKEHVAIEPSHIEGAGKGLFADDPTKPLGAIVFRKGTTICPYLGQPLTSDEIEVRYGGYNPPYTTATDRDNRYLDAALLRGIGSIPNHSRKPNAKLVTHGGRVRVVANGNIRNGAEITINYGRGYRLDDGSLHSTR
jgi:hypothetical protein